MIMPSCPFWRGSRTCAELLLALRRVLQPSFDERVPLCRHTMERFGKERVACPLLLAASAPEASVDRSLYTPPALRCPHMPLPTPVSISKACTVPVGCAITRVVMPRAGSEKADCAHNEPLMSLLPLCMVGNASCITGSCRIRRPHVGCGECRAGCSGWHPEYGKAWEHWGMPRYTM